MIDNIILIYTGVSVALFSLGVMLGLVFSRHRRRTKVANEAFHEALKADVAAAARVQEEVRRADEFIAALFIENGNLKNWSKMLRSLSDKQRTSLSTHH